MTAKPWSKSPKPQSSGYCGCGNIATERRMGGWCCDRCKAIESYSGRKANFRKEASGRHSGAIADEAPVTADLPLT